MYDFSDTLVFSVELIITQLLIDVHTVGMESDSGYNYDSTPIRLQFDRATTIRRPTLRP